MAKPPLKGFTTMPPSPGFKAPLTGFRAPPLPPGVKPPPPPGMPANLMAGLPTHAEWISSTSATGRSRSPELQALDRAIQRRESKAVIYALDAWIATQTAEGKDWRKNRRNDKGAFTSLHRHLHGWKRRSSPEQLRALRYIAFEQRKAIQKQFSGRRLVFKGGSLAGLVTAVGRKYESVKMIGEVGVKGGLAARNAAILVVELRNLFGQLDAQDLAAVMSELKLGTAEGFLGSVTPFLGSVIAGTGAVLLWKSVAGMAWKSHKLTRGRLAIAQTGDPLHALEAVTRLLKDEIRAESIDAGVATANFAARLGLTFVDGGVASGPAIGAMQALIDIVFYIVRMVKDRAEINAANTAMSQDIYDMSLFDLSPILGCYFLLMQDHSSILNMALAQYGTLNWQDDVERLMPQVYDVLEAARLLVGRSRFEIREFSGEFQKAKGIPDQLWGQKTKLGMVLDAKDDLVRNIERKLEIAFEKPDLSRGIPPTQHFKQMVHEQSRGLSSSGKVVKIFGV